MIKVHNKRNLKQKLKITKGLCKTKILKYVYKYSIKIYKQYRLYINKYVNNPIISLHTGSRIHTSDYRLCFSHNHICSQFPTLYGNSFWLVGVILQPIDHLIVGLRLNGGKCVRRMKDLTHGIYFLCVYCLIGQ